MCETEIRDLGDPQGQRADRRGGTSVLPMDVHPEPAQATNGEREVDGGPAAVGLLQPRRHEGDDGRFDVISAEDELRCRHQASRDADHRRCACDKQQVTALDLPQTPKPGFDRAGTPGRISRSLRGNEVQLGGEMIQVVVEIAHGGKL